MKVYHGTTLKAWRADNDGGDLHVATSFEGADSFAEHAAESEAVDVEEAGGDPETEVDPVVVEFDLADLERLRDAGEGEFGADQAWWERHGDNEWRNSLDATGCFAVEGFPDARKDLGRIHFTAQRPESAPRA